MSVRPGRRLRLRHRRSAFTLLELLAAVVVLCVILALLLPFLSSRQQERALSTLGAQPSASNVQKLANNLQTDVASVQGAGQPGRPAAHVKTFEADIALTPSLSVGTAEPESIYGVTFAAKMDVKPAVTQVAAVPGGGVAKWLIGSLTP